MCRQAKERTYSRLKNTYAGRPKMDPGAGGLAVVVPLLIVAVGDVCHVKNRVCSHLCAFLHRALPPHLYKPQAGGCVCMYWTGTPHEFQLGTASRGSAGLMHAFPALTLLAPALAAPLLSQAPSWRLCTCWCRTQSRGAAPPACCRRRSSEGKAQVYRTWGTALTHGSPAPAFPSI